MPTEIATVERLYVELQRAADHILNSYES
jgi:hypothetical protein